MADKPKRRKGETTAAHRARVKTVKAAERETARNEEKATAGDQAKGLGAMEKKTKTPMPKQADYTSTSAWMTAVRKWREDQRK